MKRSGVPKYVIDQVIYGKIDYIQR
jgi:hypothetical protein